MSSEVVYIDALLDRAFVKATTQTGGNIVASMHEAAALVFNKSLGKDYVEHRLGKLKDYREQLVRLLEHPVLVQRTPEWYEARNTMITASDFAQALGCGKFGTQKQFYQKKCGYEEISFDSFSAPLKWGVKYEPVACDAYAHKNGVTMHEFGLLRHPDIPWVGASPDGITELGVMVEIKCPFKRKITGEIPTQYYYQMQGQLDVCGLHECDFLECEFLEYDCEAEFVRHFHDNSNPKGIIIETGANPAYLYSPYSAHADLQALLDWYKNAVGSVSSVVKTYFWQLHTYSVVRVYRDDTFLRDKVYTPLRTVWEKLVAYKADRALYDAEICTPVVSKAVGSEKVSISISTSSRSVAKLESYAFREDTVVKTSSEILSDAESPPFKGYAFIDEA